MERVVPPHHSENKRPCSGVSLETTHTEDILLKDASNAIVRSEKQNQYCILRFVSM